MVITPKSPNENNGSVEGRMPIILSVILHVVVIILVIVGLPHFKSEPEIVETVPVELITNVSEITASNKPPVEAPKPDKEDPPKKVEKPKPEVKKAESAPKPPEENTEKIPDKAELKKEEKKPEVKKPEVKKEEKKPKQDEKSFDSLLNDLAPEEKEQPDTEETAKKVTNAKPSPKVSRFSDILSISEMDALRQQLGQCWSVMAGAENADDLRVEVKVTVNMDKTVGSAKIVDQSRYNSDTFFRAAADSALRALRNPLCTPLNLPTDKYNQWREMTITFDPREMF